MPVHLRLHRPVRPNAHTEGRPARVARPQREVRAVRPNIERMRVEKKTRGWALMVDDITEPAWVVSTKARAVAAAKDAAAFHECLLRVLTSGGGVQRVHDFRPQAS